MSAEAPAPGATAEPVEGPLSGKTLVVTGTLQKYSRDEIESLIRQHGGHAASSVSKSTDYLVAGGCTNGPAIFDIARITQPSTMPLISTAKKIALKPRSSVALRPL